MRGRGRKRVVVGRSRIPGEITAAREAVERAWFHRTERIDELATLVTAGDNHREPFHRWIVFKQAFSPKLVRRFLAEALPHAGPDTVVLDPFSGTGTVVVECARRHIPAIGIDTLMSLAYVTHRKWSGVAPDEIAPQPEVLDPTRLSDPMHRAALVCAAAAQTTGKGTINKNARALPELFRERLDMFRDDLRTVVGAPLRTNLLVRGDARTMSFLADESIAGILTSPPYLSRHDYTKLTQPFERVYESFDSKDPERRTGGEVSPQPISAHPRARTRSVRATAIPAAAAEACDALEMIDERKLSRVVRTYFGDMRRTLRSCFRVLQRGAPCWIVVGGARFKDVYIPSDTILADEARSIGFDVTQVQVARDLVPGRRKFGALTNIAPRESILVMERPNLSPAERCSGTPEG